MELHRWCSGYRALIECGRSFCRCAESQDYTIGISCFPRIRALEDWLVRNQNNVFEWSYMSTLRQMYQWDNSYACWSSTKQSSSHRHDITGGMLTLVLVLGNNRSLTQPYVSIYMSEKTKGTIKNWQSRDTSNMGGMVFIPVSYIVAVHFIGGRTRRKPRTCYKLLTNFITWCCIECTSPVWDSNSQR